MGGYTGSGTIPLLKNQTADETTSKWADVRGRTSLVFYITGDGTTSSGVVTLEEMLPVDNPLDPNDDGQPYSGTASVITTVNASTVTGGAQVAVHAAQGAYGFVRARITTAIGGGGSISVGLGAV